MCVKSERRSADVISAFSGIERVRPDYLKWKPRLEQAGERCTNHANPEGGSAEVTTTLSVRDHQRLVTLPMNSTAPTNEGHPIELKILFYAAFVVSLPLTLIGNGLLIFSVVVNKNLRTATNALIVSLSLADLPVGLLVFPMIALTQKYGPELANGQQLCHVVICITEVFLISSCLHLLFISVDRYIAITIPLRYQVIVTSHRVKRVIASVWSVSLLVSILPFLGWREVRERNGPGGYCLYHLNLDKSYILFLHVSVCLIPLTITCLAYCKIFQVAKEQAQKIAAMTVCVGEKEHKRRKLDQETKITLTVAIVVGVFIVCWGPLNILLLVYCVCQNCISPTAMETAEVFSMMNSGCNPLIYGIFNKEFRRTFKAILTCRCRHINREEIPGSMAVLSEHAHSRAASDQ